MPNPRTFNEIVVGVMGRALEVSPLELAACVWTSSRAEYLASATPLFSRFQFQLSRVRSPLREPTGAPVVPESPANGLRVEFGTPNHPGCHRNLLLVGQEAILHHTANHVLADSCVLGRLFQAEELWVWYRPSLAGYLLTAAR